MMAMPLPIRMRQKAEGTMTDKPLTLQKPDSSDEHPQISTLPTTAGGWGAISASLHHARKEMGFVRSLKTLSRVNQREGFDCPGCAWPDPDDKRALVEFCENGVKAVAEEATTKLVRPDFFARFSLAELAQKSDYWLGKQGRLSQPMWRPQGASHYQPITWEQAFDLLAEELTSLKTPHQAIFYTSGRTSNEAAFVYQLFVRLFGTNNLPDCSNMCHESSGVALSEVLGIGKGTVTLADFDEADCILVVGQNPGTNHPRMLTTLQKAARRGCEIITINPLPEVGLMRFKHPQEIHHLWDRGTPISSLFLPVKIAGDLALIKGLLKILIEQKCYDQAFIDQYTTGFPALVEDVRMTSWEAIEAASGLSQTEIHKAAAIIARSQRLIACWAMGLTQHKHAVATIQSLVNVLLLNGHVGRPGAGVCPVRGHSNVQGDRTMGIWEKPSLAFLQALEHEFNFIAPKDPGYDTVEAIHAMASGKASIFFAMGGNFLAAAPDTEFTAKAVQNCRLTAHVSTKLNRSHVITGKQALILPCLARSERDEQGSGDQVVSVENSMGIVHMSKGSLRPASPHLKSEVSILANLARAVFARQSQQYMHIDWSKFEHNYDAIREHISRVIPGFADYNTRLRQKNGFYLPNPVRDERKFTTKSQKAMFSVHPIPEIKLLPGQFLMMTIRSHDQYNTTIYGLDDRYRGIRHGRRVVLMNAADMHEMAIQAEDQVNLISHFAGKKRIAHNFVVVPYAIPRTCVATYFPEANVLVAVDSVADKSNTPTSKSIVITIERI